MPTEVAESQTGRTTLSGVLEEAVKRRRATVFRGITIDYRVYIGYNTQRERGKRFPRAPIQSMGSLNHE
jgi:hypothetical protein